MLLGEHDEAASSMLHFGCSMSVISSVTDSFIIISKPLAALA
jgi:hypothetical protein